MRLSCLVFGLLALSAAMDANVAYSAANSPFIETAFSPGQNASAAIIDLIKNSKKNIFVAAYSFTSKDICYALLEAKKRGVEVRVVLDKSNAAKNYSVADLLSNLAIPTRIDYNYNIMHNKYLIVDENNVETGSFNYTKSAEKYNAENIIIMHNYPAIAAKYLENWRGLWGESRDYEAKH